MIHLLPCFVVTPINLIGGRFTTGTGLSVSILYFVNRTTGRWSAPYFTNAWCADKDTYVDVLYTSFSLHDSVALLYCNIISNPHIILAGRCHIQKLVLQ